MLKIVVIALLLIIVLAGAGLGSLALLDARAVHRVWQALLAERDARPPAYDPAMVADLPEAARRYFAYAIAPGTPLSRVVVLQMEGDFLLGGRPMPMRARQVLAPPQRGFVWTAAFGDGVMRIGGSDAQLGAESWTRFGLWGMIPVARLGGSADHRRSAGTRAMMEAIWVPAALLPQYGAVWEQTGPDGARISFPALIDVAPMELTLGTDGQVLAVTALRWSDANADRTYRLQPFGGHVTESRQFGGFTIPSQLELGNLWGTPAYDGFFRAVITRAEY